MSKILDMLKQEESRKANSINEQLAKIYISPTEEKELIRHNKQKHKNIADKEWLGLVLTLAILCVIAFFLLFSTNKVNINITIIKEEKLQELDSAATSPKAELSKESLGMLGFPPNTVEFSGSANEESTLTEQYLYLVNSRGPGWADAKINFTKPVNIVGGILSFSVKGKRGGEKLAVILKDINSKTYQSIDIASTGLTKEWQNLSINLNQAARWVDLTSISQIRLEFGQYTVNNPVASTIYIKDLALIKKGSLE